MKIQAVFIWLKHLILEIPIIRKVVYYQTKSKKQNLQTTDIQSSWRYQTSLNKPSNALGFENLCWLFQCDNRNRGIIRMNFDEAALLWQSTKETAGPILEIGRRLGGSTVLLSSACEDRPLTSIDISPDHNPLCEEWFKKSPAANNLNLLTENSNVQIPEAEFGLIFFDGDHTYNGVLQDTITHWSSLRPFEGKPALAVYHDAIPNDGLHYVNKPNHFEGVNAVYTKLINAGVAKVMKITGSLVILQKLEELPDDFGA